jgi:putative spermidine/putrescine transport system substrate-binding protein
MASKDFSQKLTRRQVLKLGATASAAALLGACVPVAAPAPAAPAPSAAQLLESGDPIPMDTLVAEAKKEGTLTTIALPHDWANYGELIEAFKQKYGLAINELNPDAGSAEELEAVRANKGSKGPQAPDVLDIGLGFTEQAKSEGLAAKYKVSTWDTIPLKDADGYWTSNYYGVLAFEASLAAVKPEEVPQDWADLLKPQFKSMVALAGDPTKSSEAINSIWAAGLSRTGDLDQAPMAGLEFFAELTKAGNFVPVIATAGTIAKGETPIAIQWDYLALANRDNLKGNPDLAIVVPKTGILAGPYAHAISAYAPHPFAARLWTEFLFSDEGQLLWLKGYAHPIRFDDLSKRGAVPAELAAKLPPAESYAQAAFPTLEQITNAKTVITENWRKVVLGES